MEARFKLDDWINEYGVDSNFDETTDPKEAVQYLIPSYKVDRLREIEEENKALRAKIDQFGKSTSDLKAKFIGEYYEEIEEIDPETDEEYLRKITVSWTLTKQIFKEMCEYVKNRKDEDIRP